MSLKVLPGGVHAAPSQLCPKCEGRRCEGCAWEGTQEGYQVAATEHSLRVELSGISDAQLSEAAVHHALDFIASFRSPRARYAALLLREVLRRTGREVVV